MEIHFSPIIDVLRYISANYIGDANYIDGIRFKITKLYLDLN